MIRGKPKSFDELVTLLNVELRRIDESIVNARAKPVLTGDLDMKGNRIKNVGQSVAAGDVPNRSELIERAMFEDESGRHVAHSTIVAPQGVRSKSQARDKYDLVPLGQLKNMLGAGTTDAVLTTNTNQTIRGYKLFLGLMMSQVAITAANGSNAAVQIADNTGPLGCFMRLTGPSAAFSVGGFRRAVGLDGGFNGQMFVLYNATNFAMTLLHEAAGTVAESRIRCPQSSATATAGVTVRRFGSIVMIYSAADSRWICASFA